MLVDFLILLPVTVFLLWLYAYSGPSELRGRAWWVDRLPALLALVVSLAVLVWLHMTLDVVGLYRNIVAVVSAYLALLAGLGLAWMLRWRRDRR